MPKAIMAEQPRRGVASGCYRTEQKIEAGAVASGDLRGSRDTQSTLNLLSEQIQIEAAQPREDGRPALPRFSMVAYTGGAMRIAGWRHPVVVDLAGLAIPSPSRPIRFGHDMQSGVGHTDRIEVSDGRLIAEGVVSRDTQAAREIVASARNGFPWQASIGASVEEFEFLREGQKATVNGHEFVGPVNVVRKATLGEISFVDLGADGATSATVAAGAGESQSHEEPSSRERTVNDHPSRGDQGVATQATATQPTAPVQSGASQPAATQPTAPQSATTQPAAQPATPQPVVTGVVEHTESGDSVFAMMRQYRAAQAAETERVEAIRRICAGQHAEIEARAIRDGWDEQQTELHVLRERRPVAPAAHFRDNSLSTGMLEAACLGAAGLVAAERYFDEPTLEAADRRFRGRIGLQELLLEAAWANGFTGRNFRDARGVLRFAFQPELEAGFSTIDVGGILSNVANKFLLEGFFSVERTWRNICATRNVSDFKTVTSYRLVGSDQYHEVAPGGELKHGDLGEESYTNKADTYGLMLSIDRRDIINDDLGAITTVPRKLGRGSGLKINDVFWKTFLANSAFFKTANNNFFDGTDTVLSIDGLTKAEVAFMDQVDSDGKPIGIMPSILLVPTALSAVGTQLFKSVELRDTTSSTKYPIANPHQGKFRSEVSRYLGNSSYTGYSSKAWYLLADPSDLPVIEVALLGGQEAPTIETAEADFNVLGVRMRGYHDFGVALQDPRGGVKMKGEA